MIARAVSLGKPNRAATIARGHTLGPAMSGLMIILYARIGVVEVISQRIGVIEMISQRIGVVEIIFQSIGVIGTIFKRIGVVEIIFQRIGAVKRIFQRIGVVEIIFQRIGVIRTIFKRIGGIGVVKIIFQTIDAVKMIFQRIGVIGTIFKRIGAVGAIFHRIDAVETIVKQSQLSLGVPAAAPCRMDFSFPIMIAPTAPGTPASSSKRKVTLLVRRALEVIRIHQIHHTMSQLGHTTAISSPMLTRLAIRIIRIMERIAPMGLMIIGTVGIMGSLLGSPSLSLISMAL
jgi:hypothetical protein